MPAAKFEPLDLRCQVAKAVDMFSGVAEAKGVSLRASEVGYAPLLGNAPHLRQLLNNLIDNAVKYTPSGGEVFVELARNDAANEVQLRVQDTGSGIPSDDQRHIFERFYRGESARSRGLGTSGAGLGLSICQSIVQNHGGAIHCESRPGRGTCFTVTLPLAPEPGRSADA